MNKVGKIFSFAGMGLIAVVTVTINVLALGVFKQQLQDFVFGYTVDEEAAGKNRETGEALATEIEAEGVVMVKNEDNALPFESAVQSQVNVFGWGSTQWVVGGSGSGRVVDEQHNKSLNANTDLIKALNDYGVETNTALTSFYRSFAGSRPSYGSGTLNTYDYQFHRIIEPKMSDYSASLLSNALEYSDTAIVVLNRVSGESSDAPKVQYKGTGSSSTPSDGTKSHLECSTEELELLEYVGANYEYVCVVINSTNTFNLSFLDTIEGLDSCLVVGGTGINAAKGVVQVMYGEVNPSGRLADTYPYDFASNPAFVNSGSDGIGYYTNANGLYPNDGTTNPNVGNSPQYEHVYYVDYAESIYVGYKWYETADAEGYWNGVNNEFGNGYEGVVQYPFGYGLSHTTFSWDIVGLNKANNANLNKNDTIEVTVRVKNTGDVKGKDVVELYYTAPYINGEIEKSYVNLAAFAKTSELEPGLFEDVKLSFKVEDMASYDFDDANMNGNYGYELDAGTYQIKLMTDSHHLKTTTPGAGSVHGSATINYKVASNIQYRTDSVSGNDVYNRFSDDDCEDYGIAIDGSNSNANITYLSRSDFDGTFPELDATRTMADSIKNVNLYTSAMATADNDSSDVTPTFGANNNMKLFDNNGQPTELGLELGQDPEDERWEDVLDQLTESELRSATLHGYVQVAALNSVGKPRHRAVDGPNQIGSFNVDHAGTGFPNATVLAQTWSTQLAYSFGLALGAEARTLGFDGWYGPGVNIHRSPFGGRNYEYYSEDSLLSGLMAANAIKGAKNQGVFCFLKHLICYEQESMRDSIHTWLTEQSLREIYLKPFKLCIDEGGANGIMTSYNRLGAVWAGGSKALITGVLREEWGFTGMILTDYADHQKFMNGDQALRAGGDLWMDGYSNNGSYKFDTSSATFKQHLRRAGKDILFATLNAKYTADIYNPDDDDISVVIGKQGSPKTWWIGTIIAVDVVVVLGVAGWAVAALLSRKKKATPQAAE